MNTSNILPVGSRVMHTGHGAGTITSYNGTTKNTYAEQHLGSPEVSAAVRVGLGAAIVASFYSGDRFPYVITFDSGYRDVYATTDVEPI